MGEKEKESFAFCVLLLFKQVTSQAVIMVSLLNLVHCSYGTILATSSLSTIWFLSLASQLAIASFVTAKIAKDQQLSETISAPMTGHVSDSDDHRFAASVNEIHSLEAGSSRFQIRKTNTRKQEPFIPSQAGSIRKPSRKDTRSSSFTRPKLSIAAGQSQYETSRKHIRGSDTRADAWEKAQILKIRKRYEKINSQIQAWENEKKLTEKQKLEKKKGEMELRQSRNLKHFHNKIARINDIAGGARAQAEDKRKHEEFVVKEKARKMKSTGKAPVNYCWCF